MRVYKLLLHFYPRSFRADYAAELSAIFTKRLQQSDGTAARARLWLEAIADIVSNAARLHADLLVQDVRYAIRSLSRSRGFAVTAVIVAALGIGATTASFSVADHVLVRPLPFPESHQLVRMWQDQTFRGYPRMEQSPANFQDWKRLATTVAGMAAYTTRGTNLLNAGDPQRLLGAMVSADFFAVLGVPPAIGRPLLQQDHGLDAAGAVVISERLWRRTFGGDAAVLGRPILLDDQSYVVVGVMPASFEFPSRDVELWTSFRFTSAAVADRSDTYLDIVARMNAGVSLDRVRSEMQLVAAQLATSFPKENAQTGAAVFLLRDQVPWQTKTMLLTLAAASLCMLLIACANLANLLVARALAREHELAVRAAIGASRDRLARQMLTESIVLAGLGGTLGMVVAVVAIPLLARLVPSSLPIAETPGLDVRMLALAAVVTLGTGVAFGLIPALRAGRSSDANQLRLGARSGSARGTERVRSTLVVVEVMASVVLLVATGLLVRAMWRVQQTDPGFRAEQVLTLQTPLPVPRYADAARRQQFYDQVVAEAAALPGVQHAAYSTSLPMVMRGGIWPVVLNISGLSPEALRSWAPDPNETRMASLRFVTLGFFEALGVPRVSGRDFTAADDVNGLRTAVVSTSFARQFFPDRDPIGQRFFIAFEMRTIVGIVGDVRVRGLEQASEPQVYLPAVQMDPTLMFYAPKSLAIRAAVPPETVASAVRAIIARADPQVPVTDVRPLTDVVAADSAPRRAQVRVLAGFAAVAFLLAGIGIHGLLAFAVASRTREIGLRIALGARGSEILGMVMRRGLILATVGAVLGAVVGLAAGQWLQSVLAGVSPTDTQTFVAAIVLVLLMTLFGSFMPALRAMRVDPMVAIREE